MRYIPVASKRVDVIVPIFTALGRPSAGTDYSLTGQDLLASLCNLYKRVNSPDCNERATELVLNWCRENIHPYDIEGLYDEIEAGNFMDGYFLERLQYIAIFDVPGFIDDLCKLGKTYEYYDVITRIR